MRYRKVGQTDLSLSEIGFGCGGNAGLMVRGSHQEQLEIVGRAIELGLNYFDNSPDYGNGAAEENLGRALRSLKHRPLLNSKVEIRRDNLDDIAGHVVRSTEASLQRLGVDHLDMLQIHNGPAATPPKLEGKGYRQLWIDDFLRPGGALDGLRRLLLDGKIRYAGFICRGNDGNEVRQLLDTGLFHIINVPYTLFNPTAGQAAPPNLQVRPDFGAVINAAQVLGVGAAVYSPLAGGFLTDDTVLGTGRHPLARTIDANSEASRRSREIARALHGLAKDNGQTLAQFAFSFILAHNGVTTALGGFSSRSQVEEIVSVSGMAPFRAETLVRLEGLWRTNFSLPGAAQSN